VQRAYVLGGVIVFQAVIGYVQYFTHVPAVLVGFHMLGAALAVIATARLFFASRDRGPLPLPEAAEVVPDAPTTATRAAFSDAS
jgi:heme A synthase